MNLMEEMGNKIIKQNINIKDWMPVVTYEDAIKIAKEYAKKMCEKQRYLCSHELHLKELRYYKDDPNIRLVNTAFNEEINNAPLATELK